MPRRHGSQTYKQRIVRGKRKKPAGKRTAKKFGIPVGTPTRRHVRRGKGFDKFGKRRTLETQGIRIDLGKMPGQGWRSSEAMVNQAFRLMKRMGRSQHPKYIPRFDKDKPPYKKKT